MLFVFVGLISGQSIGIAQEEEVDPFPIETLTYVCHDGTDSEICVIRTDGRGFRQLTNNSGEDLHPSLNGNGVIAYQCSDRLQNQLPIYQICAINTDGSDERVLTNTVFSNFTPSINDSGLIAFNCATSEEERDTSTDAGEDEPEDPVFYYGICTMLLDGTDFRSVTTGQASELVQPGRVNGSVPVLNNAGKIVFTCWLPVEQSVWQYPHICVVDADGENLMTLSGWPMRAFQPSINDSNIVAFSCIPMDDIPVYDRDICTINADGTGFHHLYNDIIYDDARPAMSEDGWIAYECPGGDKSRRFAAGICRVRVDGTERELLVNPVGIVQWPTNRNTPGPYLNPAIISRGAIVFECGAGNNIEICLVHSSANTIFQITDNDTPDRTPEF
jgi:hypothetical protein